MFKIYFNCSSYKKLVCLYTVIIDKYVLPQVFHIVQFLEKIVILYDCGVWDASSGASPKSYYLMHDNVDLSMMFLRKGIFCIKKQVQRKVEYIPLNPQPEMDKAVVIHRYYTTLKVDKLYKKRVTWLGEGGLQSSLAVAEYVGKFPGLAPHGNARQPTEYLRTPDIVMKEISDMTDKHKPHQIYNKLKQKYDEVTRPTGLQ